MRRNDEIILPIKADCFVCPEFVSGQIPKDIDLK